MKHPSCNIHCLPEIDAHSADCIKGQNVPKYAERIEPAPEPDIEILDTSTPKEVITSKFTCHLCNNPITSVRVQVGNYDLCLKCSACTECGEYVTISEISYCIRHEEDVTHAKCKVRKSTPIAITSDKDIELLNNARLCVFPDVNLSIEANKDIAVAAQMRIWSNMSMEEKFYQTQMMEAVYGFAYSALKKDPKELAILKQEKLQKVAKESQQIRTETEKRQKMSLPSEKKKLSLQQEFIKVMKKSGISDMDTIKGIWISKGKIWTEGME